MDNSLDIALKVIDALGCNKQYFIQDGSPGLPKYARYNFCKSFDPTLIICIN